jgi:DNA polymerase/3'-5' exonuclease PolX
VSTGLRVSLDEGAAVAMMLTRNLADATDRLEVAGSIRRGKPDVGDIELVAVPRRESVADGLFDRVEVNRLTERIDRLIGVGILASHPTDPKRGERYSKLVAVSSGLQVDLFSASEESFGLIYLIRTGPADYSHRFVTDLRKKGLHVGTGQLHRGGLGCGTYVCEVIPTPEEADVYAAASWPFIKPELRA